ncbi:unnamed protein product [Phytomonas sp. Hart1]|nr:unnamed protein product [Phytomonas sp. Hart1]|eukprot:CCW66273.1 unnamed protein product [Phytomonas sp. isolate Hart1]
MCIERHICIDGTKNFRDLGGYLTNDGRCRIKWRRCFRSDHLGNVPSTESNFRLLRDTLNIGCIIDLRSPEERKEHSYMIPGILIYKIPISATVPMLNKADGVPQFTEEHAEGYMLHLYEHFIDLKSVWKAFFRILVVQAQKDYAVLFHCKAGRDRTGFTAALIMLLLDIPLEVVYEEYLSSNTYSDHPFIDTLKGLNMECHAASALCTARRAYLERAIELLCNQYGSVKNYVENELGLTVKEIELLKQRFLEEV